MAEEPADQTDKTGVAVLLLFGVAIVGVTLLPTLIGIGLWAATRRWLSRAQYVVILIGGVVGIAVTVTVDGGTYLRWLAAALMEGQVSGVPWVFLLVAAAAVWGLMGLVVGTAIWNALPFISEKDTFAETESLVPSDDERAVLSVVQPPKSSITVPGHLHSLATVDSVTVGKRSFPIGIDRSGQPVELSEDEIRTHGVILGATGSGKSVSIMTLAAGAMDLGWDVILVDLKEDISNGGMRDFLRTYARSHAVPYQEVSLSDPDSPNWFNLLDGLGPDEARDAILSMQSFDDGYWQAVNKKMLGQLINLFYLAHEADPEQFAKPDVYSIGQILSQPLPAATKKMRAIVKASIPGVTDDMFSAISHPDQAMAQSAGGLGARLTAMYETVAGRRTLRPAHPGVPPVDVTRNGVTYIGLDSLGKPDLALSVSTAALLRLAAYAGQRTTGGEGTTPRPKLLIVDESNFVDRKVVVNLLSRARSAGIAMFLCTQGPNDWESSNEPNLGWAAITQNTNVAIIMAQGEPKSAEMCAQYLGTHKVQSLGRVVEDDMVVDLDEGHLRETTDYIVDPETLRGLRIGEAIVKARVPSNRLLWAKLNMRTPDSHAT